MRGVSDRLILFMSDDLEGSAPCGSKDCFTHFHAGMCLVVSLRSGVGRGWMV